MSLAAFPTRAVPGAGVPQALRRGLLLAALAAFAAGMAGFGWVGYLNSDDLYYAMAAQAWAEQGGLLGYSHWSLRHIIVFPMAALFRLFGRNEWTLEAPMLAYGAGLLVLTFYGVRAVAGFTAGLFAAGLLASAPVIAAGASAVYSDLPEAVMVLASVWCFHFAQERRIAARARAVQERVRGRAGGPADGRAGAGSGRGLFVLSGALAGLGFITRETTVALLLVYGVLFLANYGRDRWAYVWMGVGFALVVGLDTALLGLASGDPLHRFHVSLRGVAGDNPAMVERFPDDGLFDRHGVLVAPRWVQAPLMMLANQAIGPILWLAVPAALWAATRPADTVRRRAARLFGLLALSWFVVLCYVLSSLWLVPRYQTVTVCALAVPLGMGLAALVARGWRATAVVLALGVVAANLLLLGVSDRRPLFAERALVDSVARTGEVVRTDPVTLDGAAWLLDAAGRAKQASADPPEPGDLYLFNPKPRRALPAGWPVRAPAPEWTPVERYVEPPRPAGRAIEALGLGGALPGPLLNKLAPPPRAVTVYRVPPPAGTGVGTGS